MNTRKTALITLVFALLLPFQLPAQDEHRQHAHEPAHAETELSLQAPEQGKWESDESLRQGMSELRAAFEPQHAAYRDDEFNAEHARELADAIETQVNFMIANCRLPADAELHKLLAGALGAAKSLRESDDLHEGLHQLHRVLQTYGDYFEHPGWAG